MEPQPAPKPSPPVDDERVPLFGTWRRIYTAVIVSALAVMGLIALFSTLRY